MKKLLTLLPVGVVLAACASNPTSTTNQVASDKAYDRMAPEQFACEDNAAVIPKYSVDGQEAMVNVSLPKVNWNNQTVKMDIARAASGARYINADSPNVAYQWHTKDDLGIFTAKWANGTEYSVKCQRR